MRVLTYLCPAPHTRRRLVRNAWRATGPAAVGATELLGECKWEMQKAVSAMLHAIHCRDEIEVPTPAPLRPNPSPLLPSPLCADGCRGGVCMDGARADA